MKLPVSDHCDGSRFFNPGGTAASRTLRAVLRWRLAGGRARWPKMSPNPAFAPPPDSVEAGTVAATFVNHSTFLLRVAGAVILTDPTFADRCSPVSWAGPKRARLPGISLTDLPRPDIVLLSHNHYDHMDLASLRVLNRLHAPQFVTTLGNAATLRAAGIEAIELDWWHRLQAGPCEIIATPAQHFAARTAFDRNRSLWAGFMIAHRDGRVFFAGDFGAGPHWADIRARLGAPDLALLPIGAYEPRWLMAPIHMNPSEAVQAHLTLGARRSIGMHFGTFQLTDEAIDEPVRALDAAIASAALDPDAFITHGFGETRVYSLNG